MTGPAAVDPLAESPMTRAVAAEPATALAGSSPLAATSARRRQLVSFADQVLSGLSNFLAIAMVARALTPADFGHFSLSFALLLIVLSLLRGFWGTRMSLTRGPAHALDAARGVFGAALLAAPVLALVVGVPSLLLSGVGAWHIVVVLAVATPIVVLQDLARFAAVSGDRPVVACVSDGLWLVVVVVAYALRFDGLDGLLTWVAGALLAGLAALVLLRIAPSPRSGWQVLRTRNRTSEGMALGGMAGAMASYGVLSLANLAVGAVAAGSIRGAGSMMAPVNTLFAFMTLALLPRLYRRPVAGQRKLLHRLALVLLLLVAAWGAVLLLIPPGVGDLLLGDTWVGARSVLPWTVLEYLFLAAGSAGVLGLQAREQGYLLARLGWFASGLLAAGAVVAALVSREAWVFTALQAAAAALGATAVWFRLMRLPAPKPEPAP